MLEDFFSFHGNWIEFIHTSSLKICEERRKAKNKMVSNPLRSSKCLGDKSRPYNRAICHPPQFFDDNREEEAVFSSAEKWQENRISLALCSSFSRLAQQHYCHCLIMWTYLIEMVYARWRRTEALSTHDDAIVISSFNFASLPFSI